MQHVSLLNGFLILRDTPLYSTPFAMAAAEKDLFEVFKEMGIKYTLYRHAPFFTVEESRKARKDWVGGHCKCLFLKDKKANMVLAVVTDVITRVFSNDIAPLRMARSVGLGAVNRIAPLRRNLMRHAMGTVGDLPRLLRGAAL